MSSPSACETHCLDLGPSGRASLRVDFRAGEIVAVLDLPARFRRRERRAVDGWLQKITRPMDADPRPMRLFCMSEGKRLIGLGNENGRGRVFYLRLT